MDEQGEQEEEGVDREQDEVLMDERDGCEQIEEGEEQQELYNHSGEDEDIDCMEEYGD